MAWLGSIVRDGRTAYRLLRNGWRARRARILAARAAQAAPPIPAGSIRVALYFADSRVNLYQVRQWYAPLRGLAREHPVAIIARGANASMTIREESGLPIAYLRTIAEIETFLADQDVAVMLYVNQNAKNFQMLRYGRMWHVFINHGESDKSYMTSNQFKAYDRAFVAGRAALERLGRALREYDVERRAIPIGRPQTDHLRGDAPFPLDGRTVVFYAPTWEGDRPTMAYGSVESHGVAIARAVLASPAHRLVFRPHPRSGVNSPSYREATARIASLIAEANAQDPSAGHVYDDGGTIGWQLAVADVAVTDISAMVYDRLATGRPLVVTRPASSEAEIDERGYLGAAEWLRAEDADDVLAVLDRVMHDADARATLAHWAEHHFGDTSPGASTARFHAAVGDLVAAHDVLAAAGDEARGTAGEEPADDEGDEMEEVSAEA